MHRSTKSTGQTDGRPPRRRHASVRIRTHAIDERTRMQAAPASVRPSIERQNDRAEPASRPPTHASVRPTRDRSVDERMHARYERNECGINLMKKSDPIGSITSKRRSDGGLIERKNTDSTFNDTSFAYMPVDSTHATSHRIDGCVRVDRSYIHRHTSNSHGLNDGKGRTTPHVLLNELLSSQHTAQTADELSGEEGRTDGTRRRQPC